MFIFLTLSPFLSPAQESQTLYTVYKFLSLNVFGFIYHRLFCCLFSLETKSHMVSLFSFLKFENTPKYTSLIVSTVLYENFENKYDYKKDI